VLTLLSFFLPVVGIGTPPTSSPPASVPPPPPRFLGVGHTRWRERGWESPITTRGRTLWYSLYLRTLCDGGNELRELRRGVIYRAGSDEEGCKVGERGDCDGEASVLQRPRHPVSWVTRLQVIQALYCT
jgi:hypothetical protein